MDNLIQVSNLTKHYQGFSLEGVSLTVSPGRVVGFIGSNGAGKTTTIKAILGAISPDAGEISLLGVPVSPTANGLDAVKQQVGVVLDICAFPQDISVSNVGSMGRAVYSQWDQDLFAAHMQAFGIDPKKKVKDLSRGMGMKLSLAFALAHHPVLLILDEVTAGLDPLAREDVLDLLRTFMEDGRHGILISSHITTDLDKIADEVVCVHEGRPVFACVKDDICDLAGIARCRQVDVEAIVASDAYAPGALRILRNAYSADVLVPDRFEFARLFPQITCDRVLIEDYMTLMLKGEAL